MVTESKNADQLQPSFCSLVLFVRYPADGIMYGVSLAVFFPQKLLKWGA